MRFTIVLLYYTPSHLFAFYSKTVGRKYLFLPRYSQNRINHIVLLRVRHCSLDNIPVRAIKIATKTVLLVRNVYVNAIIGNGMISQENIRH